MQKQENWKQLDAYAPFELGVFTSQKKLPLFRCENFIKFGATCPQQVCPTQMEKLKRCHEVTIFASFLCFFGLSHANAHMKRKDFIENGVGE